MPERIPRRQALIHTATLLGSPWLAPAWGQMTRPSRSADVKKAMQLPIFPDAIPIGDRFRMARDAGFQGMEVETLAEDAGVEACCKAAERTGLVIHSVVNVSHWAHPITHDDPAVVRKGLAGLERSLRQAHALGADTVLFVPGIVNGQVHYRQAWDRSREHLKEVLPLADELKVTIAIENVANRFLLSPLEFARYIDEMRHPRLRAYFDVGNCLALWGIPQDWISTLGRRIARVHLKDFGGFQKLFVPLGEGNVDWPAVRQALDRVGYQSFVSFEGQLPKEITADTMPAWCRELAGRMDRVMQES